MDERIAVFKTDLIALPAARVVQKHITFGSCYALDEGQHFDLKASVADHFSVATNEVVVVGSGKLGFSIAPDKRYRPFGESSDIDVVLASVPLFDEIWREVFDFETAGGMWENADMFKRYLFQGWIRPDMLPRTRTFGRANDWWDFFVGLSSDVRYGRQRVRGALFRSWYHVERYQERAVALCRAEMEGTT